MSLKSRIELSLPRQMFEFLRFKVVTQTHSSFKIIQPPSLPLFKVEFPPRYSRSSFSSSSSSLIFSSSFLGARISFYCYCRGHNKRIAETIHGTPYRRRKRRLKCVGPRFPVPTSRHPPGIRKPSALESARYDLVPTSTRLHWLLLLHFLTHFARSCSCVLFCFRSFRIASGGKLKGAPCGGGY